MSGPALTFVVRHASILVVKDQGQACMQALQGIKPPALIKFPDFSNHFWFSLAKKCFIYVLLLPLF